MTERRIRSWELFVWTLVDAFEVVPRIYIARRPYRVGIGWLHKALELRFIKHLDWPIWTRVRKLAQ